MYTVPHPAQCWGDTYVPAGHHGTKSANTCECCVHTHTPFNHISTLYFLAQYFYSRGRLKLLPDCLLLPLRSLLKLVTWELLSPSTQWKALGTERTAWDRLKIRKRDRNGSEKRNHSSPSPATPLNNVVPSKKNWHFEGLSCTRCCDWHFAHIITNP